MKLEKIEGASMDLMQEELEFIKKSDGEFWQGVQELMRYGVPAYDQQGHWAEIRMKVRPLQVDMIAAVKEKMPEGWFKNNAALHRSIIAVGCKVILRLMNMEKGEWTEILDGLNQMAKKVRLEEFKKDIAALRGNIIDCTTISPQEKVKVVDLMTKLEKKILGM
jgi:hypothetical protein